MGYCARFVQDTHTLPDDISSCATTDDVTTMLERKYQLARLPLKFGPGAHWSPDGNSAHDAPRHFGTLFHQIDDIDDLIDAVVTDPWDLEDTDEMVRNRCTTAVCTNSLYEFGL